MTRVDTVFALIGALISVAILSVAAPASAQTAPRDAFAGYWRAVPSLSADVTRRELDQLCTERDSRIALASGAVERDFLFMTPFRGVYLLENEVYVSDSFGDIGVTGVVELKELSNREFGVRKFAVEDTDLTLYLHPRVAFRRTATALRVVRTRGDVGYFLKCVE